MSLQQWAENGWLRPYSTNQKEITDLLAIVERDLADAAGSISSDWRFGIAYNAALKLCTVLLYASGFRPQRTLAHYRTIQSLPLVLGANRSDDAGYLDTCRRKRNALEYDRVGGATEQDVEELRGFVRDLLDDVLNWLGKEHPELLSHEGRG